MNGFELLKLDIKQNTKKGYNQKPFNSPKEIVKNIKTHWSGIMNYIIKKINNGIVEGINSIIQTLKKRARGYKNIDNFMTMIYLKIGDFKICQI